MNCSACCLSNMLYVVGGLKQNTIEKLDTAAKNSKWELIEFGETAFSPRFWSSVSVLNNNQIAILGGRSRTGNGSINLGEIFVFTISDNSVSKASKGKDLTIVSRNNQAANFGSDRVIVFGECKSPDSSAAMSLVLWAKGADRV